MGANLVVIRIARPQDIPAILGIEQQTGNAAHWNEEKYSAVFDQKEPRRIMLLAEDNTRILGFGIVRMSQNEGEVENLAVVRDMQRQGLGTQILRRLLDLAKTEVSNVFLEVREANAAARALYTKAGFRECGRRKSYYQNPAEDAILYRL